MSNVNGWQVVVGVLGAGFVTILGWALHGVVDGVNSRIDDVLARISTIENRITGIDGSLATIHKDVGILLGAAGHSDG